MDKQEWILAFLDRLHYPRRVNFPLNKFGKPCKVGEQCHYESGSVELSKGEVLGLLDVYQSIGVSKCFNNCSMQDVVVLEYDVKECSSFHNKESCVVAWASKHSDYFSTLYEYSPMLYYNGNKSIYVIFLLTYPITIIREYQLAVPTLSNGLDRHQLSPSSYFRIPLTPHPVSGKPGYFLDFDLKPTDPYISTSDPRRLFTWSKRIIRVRHGAQLPSQDPPCIVKLVEDMKAGSLPSHELAFTVAAYLGHKCVETEGKPPEDCVEEVLELFKHTEKYDEKIARYQIEHILGLKGGGKFYLPYSCQQIANMGACPTNLGCGVSNPIQFLRRRAKPNPANG